VYFIEKNTIYYNTRIFVFPLFLKLKSGTGVPCPPTLTLMDRMERDKKSRVIPDPAPGIPGETPVGFLSVSRFSSFGSETST
jgi:hypothetical protein